MPLPVTRLLLDEADSEPGRLLQRLIEVCDAVPAGERLSLAFYYLRNERLCRALAAARARGVRVRVLTSGSTYLRGANVAALERLRADGFGDAELRQRHPASSHRRRMHLKLLLASRAGDERDVVLFGTYNPSGNDRPEPEVSTIIGDQEHGYNVLIEASGHAPLHDFLERYYIGLFDSSDPDAPRHLRRTRLTRDFEEPGLRVHLCPGRPNPFLEHLRDLERSDVPARLRIAVSHISEARTIARLRRLARAGHEVHVISHDSERRFPKRVEEKLRRSGVLVRRYVHPRRYPMHCKFILSESRDTPGAGQQLFVGSMNLNRKSYYRNDDLLVCLRDHPLYTDFDALWGRLDAAIEATTAPAPPS